jgi:hypothetical protein
LARAKILKLNSQRWIQSFLLQAHLCWLFGPSNFNTIRDLSRDLKLPVQGAEKLRGLSEKFGEWYQKTNKTEDTNKLTLLAFKIIAILHNTMLSPFIKLL